VNGGRARVQAPGSELDPQGDDPVAFGIRRATRAGARPAGSRLEGLETDIAVPPQEAVQMPAADAALGCCGGDRQLR
jgi:hypothetical protein